MRHGIVDTAARIALRAHQSQKRRNDGDPYIIHPFMIAMQLKGFGFDDEVVAAALLHDVLEDTAVTARELGAEVGAKVVAMVQVLSEDKSLPWEERKELYINNVVAATDGVKAIAVADKLYNLTDMLAGLDHEGEEFWQDFTRGSDQQKWFFRSFVDAIKTSWKHPLVDELETLTQEFEVLP
ncbi:MAG: HD domain-containing protein [Patescibacteria group bacterium]